MKTVLAETEMLVGRENTSGQDKGDTYRVLDQEIPGGYWEYRLEIMWLDGTSTPEGLLWLRIWHWKTFLPRVSKH